MKQVIYDTQGFLEKNRDLLHSDLLQLLSSCEAQLPQLFASNIEQALQKPVTPLRRNGVDAHKQSVATKFKVNVDSFLSDASVCRICVLSVKGVFGASLVI